MIKKNRHQKKTRVDTSGNTTRKKSNKKGKSKNKISKVDEDEEDTDYLYCQGLYSQSRESWIQRLSSANYGLTLTALV